ncbi:hypothetical protein RND81_03G002300 [Saponaria officinalis]|uniref:Secreted protein n=1 Tax=Saponaria officinalis TaxID=3572 RepID=A0AAW1M2K5_SAPOF
MFIIMVGICLIPLESSGILWLSLYQQGFISLSLCHVALQMCARCSIARAWEHSQRSLCYVLYSVTKPLCCRQNLWFEFQISLKSHTEYFTKVLRKLNSTQITLPS